MKIFNESGKGYWMEGVGCLRAEGENRPSIHGHIAVICADLYNGSISGDKAVTLTANTCSSANHSGPSLIILNDQGGSVMDVSYDTAACLRAQDHGHPPVVCGLTNRGYESGEIAETLRAESHNALPIVAYCFEPGIAKRLGGHSRYTPNISTTLRAEMGDNQPAVCYAIDHVVTTGGNCTAQGPCWYENICPTEKASGVHAVCFQQNQREEVRDMGDIAGALTSESGMHNTNYVVYPGDGITSQAGENNDHE